MTGTNEKKQKIEKLLSEGKISEALELVDTRMRIIVLRIIVLVLIVLIFKIVHISAVSSTPDLVFKKISIVKM